MEKLNQIFNDYIVAHMLAGAFEIGLLDYIENNNIASLSAFCSEKNLDKNKFLLLINILALKDIIYLDKDIIYKGKIFNEAFMYHSYFYWLTKGYSNVMTNTISLIKNKPKRVVKDWKSIVIAGKNYGNKFVDPYFYNLLGTSIPNTAMDLGCGSGDRLIELALINPSFTGVGIDKDLDVINFAKNRLKKYSLEKRIKLIHEDIVNLKTKDIFNNIELIFSFFTFHDLFSTKEKGIEILNTLYNITTKAKRFILCDTYKTTIAEAEKTIFSLGYQSTHILLGEHIPSEHELRFIIKSSQWKLHNEISINLPNSLIFDLKKL